MGGESERGDREVRGEVVRSEEEGRRGGKGVGGEVVKGSQNVRKDVGRKWEGAEEEEVGESKGRKEERICKRVRRRYENADEKH